MKNFFYIMLNTLNNKSLNRILQELYVSEKVCEGTVVEFGARKNSKKNFTNFIKIKNSEKIIFADKINKSEDISFQDLEDKLSFKNETIDTVLILNVLEHVYDVNNSFKEITRCLKSKGKIIGSTPFIHRIHNAPGDFNRYTPQFIEKILKTNNYTNINVEELGFGPFTAAYSIIFDTTKKIPILNNIILMTTLILDNIISLFVKTKLKKIYPITICFSADKK